MSYIDPDKLRQSFFLLIIAGLAVLLFFEMKAFLPATLGAFTLFVLMGKWMQNLVDRGWKQSLAAATLMLLSFIVIVLPIGAVVKLVISRLSISEQQITEAVNALKLYIGRIEQKTGFEILSDKYMGQVSEQVAKTLPGILGATFNTLTTLVVMYFILYFMLTQRKEMLDVFTDLTPMSRRHQQDLRKEVGSLVYSNAIGIPLIAILQGIVGLIGFLILGVKEPMLWFAITCITAMLPIVGAALAYIPLAVMFFAAGDTWRGVAMLIFGFGIIGTVDNVFRFWLQKKIGDVHPLITVFGVIIGLQLFGFIGLVFGPLLISVFILLIRIYRYEFSNKIEPSNTNTKSESKSLSKPGSKSENRSSGKPVNKPQNQRPHKQPTKAASNPPSKSESNPESKSESTRIPIQKKKD